MTGAAFWLALFSLLGFVAQMGLNVLMAYWHRQDKNREDELARREKALERREKALERRVADDEKATKHSHTRAEMKSGGSAR